MLAIAWTDKKPSNSYDTEVEVNQIKGKSVPVSVRSVSVSENTSITKLDALYSPVDNAIFLRITGGMPEDSEYEVSLVGYLNLDGVVYNINISGKYPVIRRVIRIPYSTGTTKSDYRDMSVEVELRYRSSVVFSDHVTYSFGDSWVEHIAKPEDILISSIDANRTSETVSITLSANADIVELTRPLVTKVPILGTLEVEIHEI
jgi:hypothetical protein